MKKGVLITFDFTVNDLKKYYSLNSPQGAYRDIQNYLLKQSRENPIGFRRWAESENI